MKNYPKKTIGELCNIIKGETGIASAIAGEYTLVTTGKDRKTSATYQFDAKAVCLPLISSSGHGKKSLNYIHYQEGKFALGTILAAIIPKNDNEISAAFLHQYLLFYKDVKIVPLMRGAANVSLAVKDVAKIEIPLPPINEQKDFIIIFNKLQEFKNKLIFEFDKQEKYVSQLKQTILQEAIAGQLTTEWRTQNPMEKGNPETDAASLLAKIKAEKQRLITDGKLKKEKPLAEVVIDEIPFPIPDSWVWCRLRDICMKITDGFHNTPKKQKIGIPYISATHVKSNNINWNNCDYVDENNHRELWNKAYPQKGEILIVNIGAGCGTTAIIDVDYEFSFKNTAILKFNQALVINSYFLNYLISVKEKNYVELTQGGLQPFLSLKVLNDIFFPLPPLAEQKAIVEKCDRLMNIIDQLEQQIKHRKQLAEDLMQTVLCEAFE